MKKIASLIAMLLLSSAAMAEPMAHCDQMMAFGSPTQLTKTPSTSLCRISYFVKHDDAKKVPVYSAEYLLKENLGGKNKRVNAFKADPDLDARSRAELSDYDEKYDRGHMVPFEDARINSAAALQTFYLSNMIPQNLHLNRGLWRAIENKTRDYAMKSNNGIYVITGPVFNSGVRKTIGNGVAVPDMVFKVIIDKATMQGVAYLVPNQGPKKGDKPNNFKVPIAAVERVTGLNFTPGLLDAKFKTVIGANFQ